MLVIGLMWYFYIEAIDVAILYINSSYLLNNLSYTYPYYPYAIGLFSHKLLSYSVLVVIPPLINAIAYLRIKSIILKEATKEGSAVTSFWPYKQKNFGRMLDKHTCWHFFNPYTKNYHGLRNLFKSRKTLDIVPLLSIISNCCHWGSGT